jgi:hypothetical protein
LTVPSIEEGLAMWRETGRFQAMDYTGKTHSVLIEVDMLDTPHGPIEQGGEGGWIFCWLVDMLDTPHGPIEGITRFITDDGHRLYRISKGVYQTWDDGTSLTSTDPAAP